MISDGVRCKLIASNDNAKCKMVPLSTTSFTVSFPRIGYEIDEFQIKSESISFSQEANPRVIDKEEAFPVIIT